MTLPAPQRARPARAPHEVNVWSEGRRPELGRCVLGFHDGSWIPEGDSQPMRVLPLKEEIASFRKTLMKPLDFLSCHWITSFPTNIIIPGNINLDSFGIKNAFETSDITFKCLIITFRSII